MSDLVQQKTPSHNWHLYQHQVDRHGRVVVLACNCGDTVKLKYGDDIPLTHDDCQCEEHDPDAE